jgi:hypothetical protein
VKSASTFTQSLYLPALGVGVAFILAGCGGGGGGSGTALAPSPDPLEITSVQTGTPVCSTVGNGSLDGSATSGTFASVTLTPSCSDPSATMNVHLGVNAEATNITHYDWEIVGWNNSGPHGRLDKYDEVIDVDPINGRYIVRVYAENSLPYSSATASELAALTAPFTQEISVTAWTEDGRFGTATFRVTVQPGGTAVSSILGTLTSDDSASHGRAGHYSDFYRIIGDGTTTLTVEGFDSYLYVYDSARSLVAEQDEGAANGGSRRTVTLASGQTYYVEVTSYEPAWTGSYQVSSTRGGLSLIPSPWSGVNVANIAGNYNISEDTTITLVYDGITTTTNAVSSRSATITQSGPSFSFRAVDPSGTLPPTTRYGVINGNNISLHGEPFIPGNPDITVSSNTQTSSGTLANNRFTITTTSELQGSYKGQPLVAQVNSTATFSR